MMIVEGLKLIAGPVLGAAVGAAIGRVAAPRSVAAPAVGGGLGAFFGMVAYVVVMRPEQTIAKPALGGAKPPIPGGQWPEPTEPESVPLGGFETA